MISLAFFIAIASRLTTNQVLAAAPTFGPNILVSDALGTFGSSSDGPPILDIDIAGRVYVAWIDHRNLQTEVFFSKMTPDGPSFSANKPLTGISDSKSYPQIEEDEGVIYIAWHERRVTGGVVKNGIFFTKSVDGGQTFLEEEIFIDAAVGLPTSMVAHDGQIYIVYSIIKEVCCFSSWLEIWIARSQDQGRTFTKSRVAGSQGSGTSDQRPAVDFQADKIFVSWYDYSGIKFASSTDGGAIFEVPHYIFKPANAAIHRLGNTFGRMSLKTSTSGTIFIAFDFFYAFGNPERFDSEVYSMKSTDSGVNFTTALRLSDDDPNSLKKQARPSLTLLPDGSPVVAWVDERDGPGKIMLVYSEDQGETFSPNIRINNTPINHAFSAPTIVADSEGKIHFVRMDAALSPAGVWYTKIDLGLHFDTTPTPFLDLPWDYEGKGLTFTEAALSINSYLDHEYPLLSIGLDEPLDLVNFRGLPRKKLPYSGHDGYDYGKDAKALISDPVLAAASGCASYIKTGAGGNVIKINHGNGYESRYLHLLDDGLITKSLSCIQVTKGQQIGKVGYTGNVIPQGEEGAHIHFMVIQDKNNDGNFEDNIPDGITDPFGWQSTEPDPWPDYSWGLEDNKKTGNSSFYLWTKAIDSLSDKLTSNGGFFQLERYKLNFAQNATNQNLNLRIEAQPTVKASNILKSIGTTIKVTAKDITGNIVTSFQNFFTITITFNGFDLTGYNTETISIYSSEDGTNWVKEETTVNFNEKTASAEINHLSYFALMAEKLDITVPTTTASLTGSQGQIGWYRSDVQVSLNAQDNQGGLGVDYTLYKINNEDWKQYANPLPFNNEGNYTIQFYSVDKDENIENIKSVNFNIDKTQPVVTAHIERSPDFNNWYNRPVRISFLAVDNESGIDLCIEPITYSGPDTATALVSGNCTDNAGNIGEGSLNFMYDDTLPEVYIQATPNIIWSPNNKMIDVKILGSSTDTIGILSKVFGIEDEYNEVEPAVNNFDDVIKLMASRKGEDLDGRKYVVQVTIKDLAGNENTSTAEIIIPHDKR
ncbi:MAG: peptidoglycan DD-metalloendopeptidase family protein [Candidatus Curtissbacteria bacterium]|nr:peptidoglycan DD-metalloendopeptidase family protein [Candidatus Curtissbacteria bacterium]